MHYAVKGNTHRHNQTPTDKWPNRCTSRQIPKLPEITAYLTSRDTAMSFAFPQILKYLTDGPWFSYSWPFDVEPLCKYDRNRGLSILLFMRPTVSSNDILQSILSHCEPMSPSFDSEVVFSSTTPCEALACSAVETKGKVEAGSGSDLETIIVAEERSDVGQHNGRVEEQEENPDQLPRRWPTPSWRCFRKWSPKKSNSKFSTPWQPSRISLKKLLSSSSVWWLLLWKWNPYPGLQIIVTFHLW